MNIEVEKLRRTFDEYNSYEKEDRYGKKVLKHRPFFDGDEFFIGKVTPALHYTMGGLAVDENARVYCDKE